ncbi:hypothetical protein RIF29_05752 [Crotalaria pallida]|uniref:Uncharacterized protein n=1 Tax=Crotalaria pallida TaxID=3830 RepID=A0AAN9J2N8_CROPI
MPEGYFDSQWNVLKALCERNRENRQKQTISHTCGAKSLPRRRHDLKIDTGNTYGRGPMWQITHKYMDGSYVNEEAQEKGDKIDEIMRENPEAFSEISAKDPVGVVLGKEHPGGRIPEDLTGVFANFTQQAPNGGSRAPSPNASGRSWDASNTHDDSMDH